MPKSVLQQSATPGASDPDTWVDRYGDYLFRFAMLRVRDPGVAEEVVQDTLVAALQARERFSGKSSERSWLTGILKHKIIDHFRRITRERPVDDVQPWTDEHEELFDADGHWRMTGGSSPTEWDLSPSRTLEQKEFFEALAQCLSKLPRRIADAFTLRELEEMRTDEICKALNISPTNLWVMLHRARVQLRRCVQLNWFNRRGASG